MRFGLIKLCIFFIIATLIPPLLNGQPTSDTASSASNNTDDTEARQLRIYREALFQGSSEDVRIDAAIGLLLRKDSQSREILLSALKSVDNPLAQQAVCKAIIKSRGVSQSMGAVDMFLEPLLGILRSTSTEQAELAAEAMLVFDYAVIAEPLNQILQNSDAEQQHRIHTVYAIQLRPEPSALKQLIGLLDDSDREVSIAAEKALQESFGIPVGTSRSEWAMILNELQQKNPSDIRRERLLRQEIKLRQVQAESLHWQKLYLTALDKQYELSDQAAASKMILDMINSDLGPVRLWALDKIVRSPANANDKIKEKLLGLLWDTSRQVRLQTAKTLKTMSATNPAAKLLERFSVEKDPDVALAIFEALGEACFFAFSPGSKIDLPLEIKEQTLQIASEYLKSIDSETVLISAEVFRKLLELNDIEAPATQAYLQQLQQRYTNATNQNEVLRADLLGILAHLCGQGGAKTAACELYKPLFIESLTVDGNPPLRLAAATGIAYVDKNKAHELFQLHQLQNAESAALRHIVIDVAGYVGDATDLDWLLKRLGQNGQDEHTWEAIERICKRQKAAFLLEFIPTLQTANGNKDEYVRSLLNIAEQKAIAEQNQQLLKDIREKTIHWMIEHQLWEQAVSYLDNPGESAITYSDSTQLAIVKIYLYGNQPNKLSEQVTAKLDTADVEQGNPELMLLREYFNKADVTNESKQTVLKVLQSIEALERPVWTAFVNEINILLNPPQPPTPQVNSQPDTNAVTETEEKL